MEKYNDTVSKDYSRSSNHRGVSALKQLFLKKNKEQLLEAAGVERVKGKLQLWTLFNFWSYRQNMYCKMQQM